LKIIGGDPVSISIEIILRRKPRMMVGLVKISITKPIGENRLVKLALAQAVLMARSFVPATVGVTSDEALSAA
jgi:hypothetical protein